MYWPNVDRLIFGLKVTILQNFVRLYRVKRVTNVALYPSDLTNNYSVVFANVDNEYQRFDEVLDITHNKRHITSSLCAYSSIMAFIFDKITDFYIKIVASYKVIEDGRQITVVLLDSLKQLRRHTNDDSKTCYQHYRQQVVVNLSRWRHCWNIIKSTIVCLTQCRVRYHFQYYTQYLIFTRPIHGRSE